MLHIIRSLRYFVDVVIDTIQEIKDFLAPPRGTPKHLECPVCAGVELTHNLEDGMSLCNNCEVYLYAGEIGEKRFM